MSNINDFVIENGELQKYKGQGGDVVIPEGVTSIGDCAFSGCSSLTSVVIPDGVTSIGNDAFWGCSSLTSVVIPDSVTSIGDSAFESCCSLSGIVIPDSVTSIGARAFKYCPSLASVVIPEGVTSIGKDAFSDCSSLTSIVIPEGVTSIGARAFYGCKGLASVVIPEGVTSIGGEAFARCKSLTRVVIPEGVTSIGIWAFQDCSSLTSVVIPRSVTGIGKDAFGKCPSLNAIVAPSVPLQCFTDQKLGAQAACGFLSARERYTDQKECGKYKTYCGSQRKKILPLIFRLDDAKALSFYFDEKKIAPEIITKEYLNPAKKAGAQNCVAYLKSLGVESKPKTAKKKADAPANPLFDGVHFSLDGKKLIKYPADSETVHFDVPEGVVTIEKEAFNFLDEETKLREIFIPESVKTIKNPIVSFWAFGDNPAPMFIKLPKGLKKKFYPDSGYCCYAAYDPAAIGTACYGSNEGDVVPVYLGGKLDDLDSTIRRFAVFGFLLCSEYGYIPEEIALIANDCHAYIKNHEDTFITTIKRGESDFITAYVAKNNLLSEKGANELLNYYSGKNDSEFSALLLDYKNRRFGAKPKKDEFSLSDDDPELKRMLKMNERREAIKDQVGIKGIVFVGTGNMKNFGWTDEYTGAHHLDDLEGFIIERGGIYRNSVSSKTDYLICNDPNSQTTKSKKAAELGVTVITEDEFLKMAGGPEQ